MAELLIWSSTRQFVVRGDELGGGPFELRQGRHIPTWEPPADVFETAAELLIFVALPGVESGRAEAAIEHGELVVAGIRHFPDELRAAKVHRLELPRGLFERRISLPPGRYESVSRQAADGCLVVRLHKSA